MTGPDPWGHAETDKVWKHVKDPEQVWADARKVAHEARLIPTRDPHAYFTLNRRLLIVVAVLGSFIVGLLIGHTL